MSLKSINQYWKYNDIDLHSKLLLISSSVNAENGRKWSVGKRSFNRFNMVKLITSKRRVSSRFGKESISRKA